MYNIYVLMHFFFRQVKFGDTTYGLGTQLVNCGLVDLCNLVSVDGSLRICVFVGGGVALLFQKYLSVATVSNHISPNLQ